MDIWHDRTAFVTGGARGIGLGIARALAHRGVKLALADIDPAALAAAQDELGPTTQIAVYQLDVRDRVGFAAVADAVERALGPVTLLFNNAGIAPGKAFHEVTYPDWDQALDVNLGGVVNGIQTFVPRMIAAGQGGHVINTASGAGLVSGTSGFLYTSAKFAVVGLSESLRLDLAPYGIDVSVLCPGPVDTDILVNTHGPAIVDALPQAAAFLKAGKSTDEVAELVLAGIARNDMWIHTDPAMVRPLVQRRHDALLESFEQQS